ncbi:MAG: redoxin family protein [Hyphomonas sp.]|uniref:redoxin family protein n=1 Tax=Hyphomonas sp. TaxID=87 RepID=UPI003527AE55
MKRWLAAIPIAALILFAVLAGYQLSHPEKAEFERVSRMAPDRAFERFEGDGAISFAPPPGDEAVVVNLFASWCAPCVAEHPRLVELGKAWPGRVYGVLYKDTLANGEKFLSELGNPYADIVMDPDGQGGLDFGLTGVPETFVISSNGEILEHIAGPLDDAGVKRVSEALKAPRP